MSWWLDYYRDWHPHGEARLDDTSAAAEAAFVAAALKLPAGADVLDIGCGYGKHVVHLAAAGYSVTGVDASPELLRRSRASADKCGLHVNWLEADMRDLPFAAQFDAAVFLGATFGSLGDAGDTAALAAAAGALKPGGRFLVEIANAYFDTAQLVKADNRFVDWSVRDGAYRLVEASFDVRTCMGTFSVTRMDEENRRQCRQHWRAYTCPELCRMLDATGFKVETVYGGLDGSEFTLCSPRMVVVAGKT